MSELIAPPNWGPKATEANACMFFHSRSRSSAAFFRSCPALRKVGDWATSSGAMTAFRSLDDLCHRVRDTLGEHLHPAYRLDAQLVQLHFELRRIRQLRDRVQHGG